MKNYRFYACMPEGRGSKAHPFQPWTVKTMRDYAARGVYVDCVAVWIGETGGRMLCVPGTDNVEGVASVYDYGNSPCCGTSMSRAWLAKRCTRIPAELVKTLHPELWRYLTTN